MPIDLSGNINPCLVFYLREVDCIKRETFFDLMCRNEKEDYLECKLKRRNVSNK